MDFGSALKIAAPVAGGIVGGPAGASVGLGVAGMFGAEETTKAQAKAAKESASYQYKSTIADIESQERMFDKQLDFNREQFEYLKTESEKPTGPLAQSGSYGYPYVSVQTSADQKPSFLLPLALVVGFFFFKRKK